MVSPKETAKRLLGRLPPFSRWLEKLEALRKENHELRAEKEALTRQRDALRIQLNQTPPLWQQPGHFYSPIPSHLDLELNAEEIFTPPRAIRGVDLNSGGQLEMLDAFEAFYTDQPFTPQKVPGRRYFFENPNFGYSDAVVLYSLMRHLRPRRIVEVGSGYSSCAMMDVDELFLDRSVNFTFIDPYPQLLKGMLQKSDHSRLRIVAKKVQDADTEIFRTLGPSDILFIDSSHVVKTGSDVNYLIFKILPLLAAGVWVHIHDIFYPFEYPRDWVFEGRAWNEAYLVRAFLQYNHAFRIRFFTSYLTHAHREAVGKALPLCLKDSGGSLWMEKVHQDSELDRLDAPTERRKKAPPHRIMANRLMGDGWYEPEGDHCWMREEAWVELAGPARTGQRIRIRGFNPHRGARLSLDVDGVSIGSIDMPAPGLMETEFSFPPSLIGRSSIAVRLAIDRVYEVPGDPRVLGFSMNLIEII